MNGLQTMKWDDWVASGAVVALTILLAGWSRGALCRISARLKHEFARIGLERLCPYAPALIVALGLRLLAETVPLTNRVPSLLVSSANALGIVVIVLVLWKLAILFADWALARTGVHPEVQRGYMPLLNNLITIFFFLGGAITLLRQFGFDVFSLLTALGVGSLAVGLAAKETLSNMISGFVLMVDQNFVEGDRVNLGGQVGDVMRVGFRSTRLITPEGNILIVPNADLTNSRILNLSAPGREVACTLSIRVPLDVPFRAVQEVVSQEILQLPQKHPDRAPSVLLTSLAEGNQLVTANFWVKDLSDTGAAVSDVNSRILLRFQRAGISLVGSQTTVVNAPAMAPNPNPPVL